MLLVFSIEMKEGPCVLRAIHPSTKAESIRAIARRVASRCLNQHLSK